MVQVEAYLLKMIFEIVGRTAPFAAVHYACKLVQGVLIEAKRLANFPGRRTVAIRNDVCGHRGAELAVPLIHVLDCFLSLVPAWQVEIDVWPLAALFREKTLEEQFHANRIDGRNSEGIANGAVGRRAASLYQDFLLTAKPNDVPNDEEVAGQM